MITMPNLETVEKNLNEDQIKVAKSIWGALVNCYIRNKGTTSGVYWMEKMEDPIAFNVYLMIQKDWIISQAIPERNWSSLRINETQLLTIYTEDELTALRTDNKFKQYEPRSTKSTKDDMVRQDGKVKKTGLVRKGFARAGNSPYTYDRAALHEFQEEVKSNVGKGMRKLRAFKPDMDFDTASYDAVADSIVDSLLNNERVMTQGKSYIDSRGRGIKESLKYVGNPIGYKDFRSLIQLPKSTAQLGLSDKAMDAIYMFIAELVGYKRGTVTGKLAFGKECYKNRTLPEAEGDELAEHIWLKRHYQALDAVYYLLDNGRKLSSIPYSVPIELDASASILGFTGALIGCEDLLTMCNMAGDPEVLNDPWYIDGLTRNHVKKAATPKLYGSSKSPKALWEKAGLEASPELVQVMNGVLNSGSIGIADKFKEFVLGGCVPAPEMDVKVWGDEFTVTCNHWKKIGDVPISYDIYDTPTGRVRRITHMKTKAIPDLERFRRFFQTLLIHNLDGQVADYVAGKAYDKYGFCLDIHDAFVVSPLAAVDVQNWYAEKLTEVFNNRHEILKDYFESIGISNYERWGLLQDEITPMREFTCRPHVLK